MELLPYGLVTAVAVDPVTPSTVYAAATGPANVVYKSMDAGTSWKALDTGTLIGLVQTVFIDPITPATVYLGTASGILKSINAGATWESASAGLPGYVSAVAIDPFAPTTLYAGTGGASIFTGKDAGGVGVFKSMNAGATWSHTSTGLPARSLNTLVVDPTAPSTLYGTVGAFILKSEDASDNWIATNLVDDTAALGIDPTTPSTLYVGTDSGVRKSTDGGVSWAVAGPDLPVSAIAIDPVMPGRLYAAALTQPETSPDSAWVHTVISSTDAGATWIDVGPRCATLDLDASVCAGVDVHTLAIDPVTRGRLYAHVEVVSPFFFFAPAATAGRHQQPNALVKSTDGGATWNEVGAGLPADYWVVALAIDPSAPRRLYAGTDGVGVFKSTDAGVTWVGTGLTDGQVTGLAIDPVTPSTLYAGTDGSGVFKSTNAGATWSMLNTGLPNTPTIFALAIDPITPSRLFAATDDGIFSIQQVAAAVATLTLKDNANKPARKSLTVTSKDAAIGAFGGSAGSGDDPTVNGGTLRVTSVAAGFDDTYPMPKSGWTYIGNPTDGQGYRYRDAKLVNGPVKAATLRKGVLQLSAKGAGLGQTLGSNPDPVSVVLQTGAKRYCTSFGTATGATTKFTAGKQFAAKNAAPPATCPP